MLIDCDCCAMRDTSACHDCVVGVLLAADPGPLDLDDAEQQAITALSEAGLVPRLRLVPTTDPHTDHTRAVS